jgi:O-antigen/teichoic acid export membrane protein
MRLWSEVLQVGAGQFATALGAFVGVRLLTAQLAPAGYGELALGLTLAGLGQQVVFGAVAQAGLRYYAPARRESVIGAYIAALGWLAGVAAAVLCSAAGVAWLIGVSSAGGRAGTVVLLALVLALTTGIGATLEAVQSAARNRGVVAWHQAAGQWLRVLGAVVLVRVVSADREDGAAALGGYALGAAVTLISQAVFFRRAITDGSCVREALSGTIWSRYQAEMVAYASPFLLWGVVTWVQLASDRWALGFARDTNEVGLYAVLFQIGSYPVTLMAGVATQLVVPILFEIGSGQAAAGTAGVADTAGNPGDGTVPEGVRRAVRRNAVFSVAVLVAGVAVALVTVPLDRAIFSVLADERYAAAAPLLPALVLAAALNSCGQAAAQAFMITRATARLIPPKLGTAVAGVSLNLIGALLFGLAGVVAANLMTAFIYATWMMVLHLRIVFVPSDTVALSAGGPARHANTA